MFLGSPSTKRIESRLINFAKKLKEEGKTRLVICGISDAAEIFYLATLDSVIIGDIDRYYELAQQLSSLSISDNKYQGSTGQRIKAVTVVQVVD